MTVIMNEKLWIILEKTIMSCIKVSAGNLAGSSKKIIRRRKRLNRKEPNTCPPLYHCANRLSLIGVYSTNISQHELWPFRYRILRSNHSLLSPNYF
jgi:hypothetical protein